jgi:hypothetical protein
VPGWLFAWHEQDGNHLTWEACEDEDFQHYCLYRGPDGDFEPNVDNMVLRTAEPGCVDPDGTGQHYYKLTAVDHAGNASEPIGTGLVPVFLSYLDVEPEGDGVLVRWEVLDGDADAEFRLEGSTPGGRWEVEHGADGPGTYVAEDRSTAVLNGGLITYLLWHREDGEGDWQLLREASITLDAAPLLTSLLGAYPNPFNPHVAIRFSLATPQRAKITVFDVAGRQVAVLADGRFPGGYSEVVWRGLDRDGRPAASGIYFALMEASEYSQSLKLVLLR